MTEVLKPKLVRITGDPVTMQKFQESNKRTGWHQAMLTYVDQLGVVLSSEGDDVRQVMLAYRSDESSLNELPNTFVHTWIPTTQKAGNAALVSTITFIIDERCLDVCASPCVLPGDYVLIIPDELDCDYLVACNPEVDLEQLARMNGQLALVSGVSNGMVQVEGDNFDSVLLNPLSLLPIFEDSKLIGSGPAVQRWRQYPSTNVPFESLFSCRESIIDYPDEMRILYQSIMNDNNHMVERLIRRFGKSLDIPFGEDGGTALMYAVQQNNLQIVTSLLQIGADTTRKNSQGWSSFGFFFGLDYPDLKILERLMEHTDRNADLANTSDEWTPLIMAIHRRWVDVIKLLLTDPFLVQVNVKDLHGQTALTHLVISGDEANNSEELDLEVCMLLLSNDADVLSADNNGYTAIHHCAIFDKLRILIILLSQCQSNNLDTQTDCYTPLHLAIEYGHVDIVDQLAGNLWCRVDTPTYDGQSVLHLLHRRLKTEIYDKLRPNDERLFDDKYLRIYESLIKNGALLDIEYTGNHDIEYEYSGSPLHVALQQIPAVCLKASTEIGNLYNVLRQQTQDISLMTHLVPASRKWPQLALLCYLVSCRASLTIVDRFKQSVYEVAPIELRMLIYCYRHNTVQMGDPLVCLYCPRTTNVRLRPCGHRAPYCSRCSHKTVVLAIKFCPICFIVYTDRTTLDGHSIDSDKRISTQSNTLLSLNKELICNVCEDKKKNIAFNCGHVVCESCNAKINSFCPFCRVTIHTRQKVFL